MKLSVEAKVAAAVAAGFVTLTVGAIGQEQSRNQAVGLTVYGTRNNSSVNTNLSQQEYNTSLIAHTDEANQASFTTTLR